MSVIKGVVPVLITPFTDDGEVDYKSIENLVNYSITEGAGAVTTFGIGSEFFKLSDDERKRMMETIVGAADKRVPVIASVTSNSTDLAIKDVRLAQAIGVDAIMMLPPYFMSPLPPEIIEHVQTVLKSTKVPFILQHAPIPGSQVLAPNDIIELMKSFDNQFLCKCEVALGGPVISELKRQSGGKIQILSGAGGMHMVDAFERGAQGVMPACALLKPFVSIYKLMEAGEIRKAWSYYEKLIPYIMLTAQTYEMYISFEKEHLYRRGIFKSAYFRKPRMPLDPRFVEQEKMHYQEVVESFKLGEDYK